ncbi:hypothetical protein DFH09DRAFT_1330121 [Mycena vulgaris]|nr:hypothetical protein DFH09DRAFT_1330121 [Mycena vulgaris]
MTARVRQTDNADTRTRVRYVVAACLRCRGTVPAARTCTAHGDCHTSPVSRRVLVARRTVACAHAGARMPAQSGRVPRPSFHSALPAASAPARAISAPPASRLFSLHARELHPSGWLMAGNTQGPGVEGSTIRIRIRPRDYWEAHTLARGMIPTPTHLRSLRADKATAGADVRPFITVVSSQIFSLR